MPRLAALLSRLSACRNLKSKIQNLKSQIPSRRLFLEPLESRLVLSTFTVINTDDSGAGSLRQAILDANDNVGPDEIHFNIDPGNPGVVHTIELLTILPATSAVTIDGTTQPGFVTGGPRLIELSGINASFNPGLYPQDRYALSVNGDSTIKGLTVNSFPTGIRVDGASNHIEGNYIGTDPSGSLALPNQSGVYLVGSNNRVGTNGDGVNDEAERNIIAGNSLLGVFVDGEFNAVAGNYIGTDATGMHAIANQVGLGGGGSHGTIVGNLVSGNDIGLVVHGIDLVVQGNFIGTDATGNAALPGNNTMPNGIGIFLQFTIGQVLVGGSTPAARNVITGNRTGIRIFSDYSIIQGNYIGRTLSGADLGNGPGILQQGGRSVIGGQLPGEGNVIAGNHRGIVLDVAGGVDRIEGNLIVNNSNAGVILANGTANQVIGGTAAGAGNTIAFNGTGVIIGRNAGPYSTQNRIVGNSIFGNSGLGIDLSDGGGHSGDGVTLNDPLDADTGSNEFQNFPELTAASSAASTRVQGSLHSTASSTFVLDFYANSAADLSGYGEGERYLGSATVTTDSSGNVDFDSASFAVLLGASSPGEFITATATDSAGNTSEFSLALATPPNQPPVLATLSATSANEDGTVHLTGTYHDAGTEDTHTLTIDWGEGAPQIVPVSGGSFDITHQYLDDNPTNTASDVYTIGVTLTDNDGSSSTAPASGLVGYWPADGHASDLSGGAHDGTMKNGVTFSTGFVGQAFSLDGVDDWISTNQAFANDQSHTIAAWVFWEGHNAQSLQELVSWWNHVDPVPNRMFLGTSQADGQVLVRFGDAWTNAPVNVPTDRWVHLAATYDGVTNDRQLFLDGVLVASLSASAEARFSDLLAIGRQGNTDTAGEYWNGMIDELRLYDRALTPLEFQAFVGSPITTTVTIANLAPMLDTLSATSVNEDGTVHLTGTYHDVGTQDTHSLTIDWGEGAPQTVPVTGGAFDITHQYLDDNPTNTASDVYTIGVRVTDDDGAYSSVLSADDGLVGYWPADGNASDLSGAAHHGTLSNGVAFSTGVMGQAFSLDGVDDWISTNQAFANDQSHTIAAWVFWEGHIAQSHQELVSWWNHVDPIPSRMFLGTSQADGQVVVRFGDGWNNAPVNVPTDRWVHLAATYDGVTNDRQLFLDGVLVATLNAGAEARFSDFLAIGRQGNTDTAGEYWNGMIDELRLYERTLSTAEIEMLVEAPVVGATTTVTISNVPPVLDSLSVASVSENGTVHLIGTYHDVGTQDTHTLTIDWGEGAPQMIPVTGGSFDITHHYVDDPGTNAPTDVYMIGATLTDDDTGSAAASVVVTVPRVRTVTIDIHPESLNVDSNGTLTVVVFGAADFDASQIDVGSVQFAGAFAWHSTFVDKNGDGRLDLQLKFRTQDTILDEIYAQLLFDDHDADGILDSTRQTAQIAVTGETLDDALFSGSDNINLFLAGRSLRNLLDELFGP